MTWFILANLYLDVAGRFGIKLAEGVRHDFHTHDRTDAASASGLPVAMAQGAFPRWRPPLQRLLFHISMIYQKIQFGLQTSSNRDTSFHPAAKLMNTAGITEKISVSRTRWWAFFPAGSPTRTRWRRSFLRDVLAAASTRRAWARSV
jgi:hypothetical protein